MIVGGEQIKDIEHIYIHYEYNMAMIIIICMLCTFIIIYSFNIIVTIMISCLFREKDSPFGSAYYTYTEKSNSSNCSFCMSSSKCRFLSSN